MLSQLFLNISVEFLLIKNRTKPANAAMAVSDDFKKSYSLHILTGNRRDKACPAEIVQAFKQAISSVICAATRYLKTFKDNAGRFEIGRKDIERHRFDSCSENSVSFLRTDASVTD